MFHVVSRTAALAASAALLALAGCANTPAVAPATNANTPAATSPLAQAMQAGATATYVKRAN